MPSKFHCLEFWRLTPEILRLPYEERHQYAAKITKTIDSSNGFPEGAFAEQAPIAWHEEATVVLLFGVVLGGPILLLISGAVVAFFGSWLHVLGWIFFSAALSLHPLPERGPESAKNWIAVCWWKYFSYRYMWCDDDLESVEAAAAWVAVAPPHGVLPLANMLAHPATNFLLKRPFLGTSASIIQYTPFCRHLGIFLEYVDVSGKAIAGACKAGKTVGVVADGIAGIFRADSRKELVAMRNRKGLSRLALRSGLPLLPCYSFGNTSCFSVWADPFGILEGASRLMRVSIFAFWGRWGLPIPRRSKITFVFGRPIAVDTQPEPSEADIAELHQTVLSEIETLFNVHKKAHGWQGKAVQFV